MANIHVYIELEGEAPTAGSLAVLNEGRQLASELGATLYAILPCATPPSYQDDDIIAVLSRHGADKVILISYELLAGPALAATHLEAVTAACEQFPPRLLLFDHSAAGLELAPRLAIVLGARYGASGRLERDGGDVFFTRSGFRRRYHLREPLLEPSAPAVLTLLPRAAPRELGDEEAETIVIRLALDAPPGFEARPLGAALEGRSTSGPAPLAVGGGAGLGTVEAFRTVEELACRLGGVVRASATACARGIAPPELAVGLDGGCVESKLYLAFGVSGSEQHLAGLGPEVEIVAVNTDPEAPIFGVSRLGVVGEAAVVLAELLQALAEERVTS